MWAMVCQGAGWVLLIVELSVVAAQDVCATNLAYWVLLLASHQTINVTNRNVLA